MVHLRRPTSSLYHDPFSATTRFLVPRAGLRGFPMRHGNVLQHSHGSTRTRGSEERLRHQEAERDFFLSVLGTSATRRDAKAFLSRFKASKRDQDQSSAVTPSHLAIVKLRASSSLDDTIVTGLCQTISQMSRLGLTSVIVLDLDHNAPGTNAANESSRGHMSAQADRLVRGLQAFPTIKASRLDDLLEIADVEREYKSTVQVKGSVEVQHPKSLTRLLERGIIPVISPVAISHDSTSMTAKTISGDDAVLALTRYFAGLRAYSQEGLKTSSSADHERRSEMDHSPYVLERLIILDPVGALPSARQAGRGHVFINLEQEYPGIHDELLKRKDDHDGPSKHQAIRQMSDGRSHQHVSENIKTNARGQHEQTHPDKPADTNPHIERHIQNLDLLRNTLSLLPPSSSAFLTTPAAAATLRPTEAEDSTPGVGTRRPKNPLIFNLLTDKPLNSSSLPASRLVQGTTSTAHESPDTCVATFAKRGMQLTMIPDPLVHAWRAPSPSEKHMSLQDPDIDFPRLLNLIEDSFNRPLDVGDYMSRICDRTAGIIIAGEYEGGALLTWELPPRVPNDGSETTRQRMVPYLDKFAVLKRSQGAGGVADIVFSAMVRSCFPEGVCWRSRKDNPVNKWYFERAAGTWKIPNTKWTMFWTGSDLATDGKRFLDYEAVCRTVKPSWADNESLVD